MWPPAVRVTLASCNKDARCAMIGRRLAEFDVALCQEVFTWRWMDNRYRKKMIQAGNLNATHVWRPETGPCSARFWWNTFSAGLWTLVKGRNESKGTTNCSAQQNRTQAGAQTIVVESHEYVHFQFPGFVAGAQVRHIGFEHTRLIVNSSLGEGQAQSEGSANMPKQRKAKIRGQGSSEGEVERSEQKLTLHVLNTHFLPSEGAYLNSVQPIELIKEMSLNQLADYLNKHVGPCEAWVLGGDFNLDPVADAALLNPFVARLQALCNPRCLHVFQPGVSTLNFNVPFASFAGAKSFCPTGAAKRYKQESKKGLAVDHFYTNARLLQPEVCPEDLSDHYAITSHLVLDDFIPSMTSD